MRTTSLAAAFVTMGLLCAAAALGHLNFARWDNTETFLPAIWYAHSELLHGRFPWWNPYQHLGEPLHAQGIAGVLYPPFTVAVALTRLLRWPEAAALDISAVMHAGFGALGMSWLVSELGVRRSLAFAAGVSVMLSGFAMVVGSMWVHVLPNVAWSIWAMWGLRRVLMDEHPRSGVVVATLSLGAVFFTGHVQSGANVWLAVWLWSFAVAAALGVLRGRMLTLGMIGLAAALLALPTILPTALILPEADRLVEKLRDSQGFMPLQALIGSLIPVMAGTDGALVHTVVINPFIGAWVLPGLILGSATLRGGSLRQTAPPLPRIFLATILCALVFVWLNFGTWAGLYPALHSLPIFSKFRMAFKYWERALPLLALAGAIGLELSARHCANGSKMSYRVAVLAIAGLVVTAAVYWIRRPAAEPLAWLAGGAALLTLFTLIILPVRSASMALVPLVVLQAIGIIAIAHSGNRSKPYRFDRRPDAALALRVKPGTTRVLPISPGPPDHPYTRPLSLFYAATLDGYESATGHRFALTSRRITENLRANVDGVPARANGRLANLLESNWLRLANVGQLVAAPNDTAALREVASAWPRALSTSTRIARIFEIDPNWPRVYFATEQVPGNDAGTYEVLFGPGAISAAAVEGDERRRPLPAGQVQTFRWTTGRIEAEVAAPEGSLLLFSTVYSREWHARVDGQRTEVVPVNGMFAGVWLPAGAKQVTLQVRRWPLFAGLLGALLGILLCAFNARLPRSALRAAQFASGRPLPRPDPARRPRPRGDRARRS